MSIRTRLTLWYTGVLFASLLMMAALSYHEFVVEPRNVAHEKQTNPNFVDNDPDANDDRALEAFDIVLTCGIPAAVLALVGGWWLMRKALAPVIALTQAVERVHEGNLGAQLPRTGARDEFDRLTEVFNEMSARLNHSFQRIREFTLHASHELKTPLTVLRGEIETELQHEGVPEDLRERLFGQLDEVQRLSKIVDGLTLLTKADAGQVVLQLETVRLDELVRDAFEDAQILAKAGNVRVALGDCDAATIRGDRHRMRQLLLNLTDNAIKYNQSGGAVDIELKCVGGSVGQLTISNTGKGIPPELVTRVFDRFFRGDASHSTAVDGCGLGLSVAKWIVSAHDGSIQLTSLPDEFTRVVVTLPLEPSYKPAIAEPVTEKTVALATARN
jgi:signal transduction histidine kinase